MARGATIYAEVAGVAQTSDAYHLTAIHPEGTGAAKAVELALKEAGVAPHDVDYLNAHATSTPLGDVGEMNAIDRSIGRSEKLHISSTKSMTGHLLGAAGAIEAIASVMAIKEGIVPPTINTTQIDEEIPAHLQIVTQKALHKKINVAVSTNFGFGGHNSVVVFKKL